MARPAFDESMWRERLRSAKLRVTGARLAVLRALTEAPLPISAQDVLERAEAVDADRVTVYRTLNSLVDARLAHRMDPGDRVWRYGLLGEEHDQHAHFVCDTCGAIRCLADATINVSFKGRGSREKFRVTQQDVYLHGSCEGCIEEGGAAAPGAVKPLVTSKKRKA